MELDVTAVEWTLQGSAIEAALDNHSVAAEFPLYQIGIYVDFYDEFNMVTNDVLYMLSQCVLTDPDVIPPYNLTPMVMSYALFLNHCDVGQGQVVINIVDTGFIPFALRGRQFGIAETDMQNEMPYKHYKGEATLFVGLCATAADVAEKALDIDGWKPVSGAKAIVRFTNTNTASNPTLNINGTGAFGIYFQNTRVSGLNANNEYIIYYDGTQYNMASALSIGATQAEVNEGVENRKFLSPSHIATETDRGTVQMATQEEVDAGLLDSKAVSPASLATLKSDIAASVPLANGQAVSDGATMGTYRERYLGSIYAPAAANRKVDIEFPDGIIFGWIEVDLFAYNHDVCSGRLTKRFIVSTLTNTTIESQSAIYINADNPIAQNMAMSNMEIKNGKRVIRISMAPIYGNFSFAAVIRMAGLFTVSTIDQIAFSDVYATDATVFPKPVNYFAGDDGAWYDLVLQNGFTAHGTYPPKYRKIGNMVYMKGVVTGVASTDRILGSLPAGFRPGYETPFAGMTAGAPRSQSAWINVTYAGTIATVAPVADASFAGAANSWFLDTSFIAEN